MSLTLAALQALMRLRPTSTATAATLHDAIAERGGPASVTRRLRRVARVRETTVAGQTVVHLLPHRASGASHLIYLHGGCYTFPISSLHWDFLAALIQRTGVGVTVPLYGLAPEHTATDAAAFLDEVWAGATAQHGRIYLGGDSAGGGLALAEAQRIRDASGSQPAGVVLVSPWLDVTMQNPGIGPVEPRDHMLGVAGLVEAGRLWRGGLDARDPLVSPLFGDLAGLPPVYTYQGSNDVFLADTKELARRMHAAGGRSELRITRGGFHDFPLVPAVPEARRTLRRLAELLR